MAHIVHVLKWYPPSIGGIEKVAEFCADAARSAGHDVTVLVCEKDSEKAGRSVTPTGVMVERLRSLGILFSMPVAPGLPFALWRLMRKADLVHFHEPYPAATLSMLLMPKPRRLVITWHGDILRQKRLKPYAEWLQDKLARRADAILATSERMPAGSPVLGRHTDRIRIMPFMIDTTPFDVLRGQTDRIAATRKRWGGRFAFACGRLIPYKGYEVLIDAVSGTDLRVVIVGEGPLRESLLAQAKERGVADQIVFAGAVDDETVRDLYCGCEFLVFPSVTQGEAFGLVQLEAMAAGRPVINTWLMTSVPTVSLDGVSGLTVEPRDPVVLREAMLKLWNDTELRERLGAGALTRIRKVFERSRVLGKLLAFYDDILAT
ncbi:MAG: glycosyltransferase [Reyranella sp.]|uniref:glycosyltransferase n=1 Tax=Reyranella sp. TaxID=1929291 RepID=UPI001AD16A84|nr:glycosyltransferase [Reyranella sp.]MBN9088903.1 glycosyltransferase [Reyranella sp.]